MVEMKMEDKKLTFRMADSKEVRSSNLKREAGNLMVGLQSKLVALSGLGGDVPALQEMMKQVASAYREADYEKAVSSCERIAARLGSEEFKKDILIKVQRRMSDYQALGADLTRAKEHFKSMAASLRDNKDEFYLLTSTLIKELEGSIKGLGIEEVSAEVVEVAEEVAEEVPPQKAQSDVVEPPKADVGPAPALVPTKETERPSPTAEISKPAPGPGPELRPVVKFVKKKLALVPEGAPPTETVKERPAQAEEPTAAEPSPAKTLEKAPTAENQEAKPAQAVQTDEEKAARQKEATEAFNRIQIVHKAATALHKKGKDVGQIFDLLRYAEEARKKGELKAYIGVSKQLESMLLSMQSKK
jgi:hypothetical protein